VPYVTTVKKKPAGSGAGGLVVGDLLLLMFQAAIARTPPARNVRVMRIRMRIEHVAVVNGNIASKA
jgi:hypothetical protein